MGQLEEELELDEGGGQQALEEEELEELELELEEEELELEEEGRGQQALEEDELEVDDEGQGQLEEEELEEEDEGQQQLSEEEEGQHCTAGSIDSQRTGLSLAKYPNFWHGFLRQCLQGLHLFMVKSSQQLQSGIWDEKKNTLVVYDGV